MTISDEILQMLEEKGNGSYFGEPVSQTEHALQAAFFATQDKAPHSLVAAALLHDIGHLLHDEGEDVADRGVDTLHEEAGERWLAKHFGQEVCEPVRLHVAAKRYLCATRPDYLAELSPASRQSLQLQGGPMSRQEEEAFRRNQYFEAAVQLRLWDDRAKIAGLMVPGLECYRELLEELEGRNRLLTRAAQ
jgi:phosphonate degradation associated HDIG domain protein